MIVRDATSTEYRLLVIRPNVQDPIDININDLVKRFNPTNQSVWHVSEDCTGFRIDTHISKVSP